MNGVGGPRSLACADEQRATKVSLWSGRARQAGYHDDGRCRGGSWYLCNASARCGHHREVLRGSSSAGFELRENARGPASGSMLTPASAVARAIGVLGK